MARAFSAKYLLFKGVLENCFYSLQAFPTMRNASKVIFALVPFLMKIRYI
jgi:hypothetical protein